MEENKNRKETESINLFKQYKSLNIKIHFKFNTYILVKIPEIQNVSFFSQYKKVYSIEYTLKFLLRIFNGTIFTHAYLQTHYPNKWF